MLLNKDLIELTKKRKVIVDSERKEIVKKIQKDIVTNSFFAIKTEGDQYKVNRINGIFIASKLDWGKVKTGFEDKTNSKFKYNVTDNDIARDIEKRLVLKEIFPIRRITKKFPTGDQQSCFCDVEILLSTGSMSRTETISQLYDVKEKAHENEEWLLPLINWLNDEKSATFYYVVNFEITCGFDIDKYLNPEPENKTDKKKALETRIDDIKADIGTEVGKITSNTISKIKGSDKESAKKLVVSIFGEDENFTKRFEAELKKRKTVKSIFGEKESFTKNFEAKLKEKIITDSDERADKELVDETSPYAQWVTEYISERVVFPDLCNVFNSAITDDAPSEQKPPEPIKVEIDAKGVKTIEDLTEKVNVIIIKPPDTTPQQPVAVPKKLRYLTYTPLDISFTVKIGKKKDEDEDANEDEDNKIFLGEKFKATAIITNESTKEVPIDDKLKINLDSESKYFECKQKPEERTVKNGKLSFSDDPPNKKPILITKSSVSLPGKTTENGIERKAIIKKELEITPKIKEISEEFLEDYPIKFTITRSTGYLKPAEENKSAFAGQRNIQVCKCEKEIPMENPIVEWTVRRPWFPHKDDQIDFVFNVELKKRANVEYVDKGIPIRLDCIFGKDFTPIEPILSDENGKVATKSEKIKCGKKKKFQFTMYANRAAVPGYSAKANFKLSVGKWEKEIKHWRMKMIVLPNLFDTFVAGIILLLGILSQYRPDIVPSFTEELDVANLAATPGIIYLAYRVLTWAKDSKETES